MDKMLHLVFGISGNAFALFLFLAPVITFKRIVTKRSAEQFSGIPYVMTLLNCLLSGCMLISALKGTGVAAAATMIRLARLIVKSSVLYVVVVLLLKDAFTLINELDQYGLPFVSPNNLLVSTINGTGAAIESIYVVIFLIYASKKEKGKIVGLLALVLAFFGIVALVSMFALHGNGRKVLCGIAAAIFSAIMYGSPLTIIKLVITSKSVEFMPFFLSLFAFLCGTSWFIFGLLGEDLFVAIPNGLGSVLGAVQLILYAVYRDTKPKKPTDDGPQVTEKPNSEVQLEEV